MIQGVKSVFQMDEIKSTLFLSNNDFGHYVQQHIFNMLYEP